MEPMHPGDRTHRNTSIRLSDLAVVSDQLQRLTFENCTLHGPAIVVLLGSTTVQQCTFDGDEEGLFWDTGGRNYLIGAIGLVDCTIVGCRFMGIGLAVPPQDREMMRRGFGL